MRQENTRALRSYVVGFLLSIVLTVIAYLLVVNHTLDGFGLVMTIMVLATAQLLVQLIFFLHLGLDAERRWNLAAFLFMGMILLIVVAGSLWIMNNMNSNMMMTQEQMDQYMEQQSNKGF